MAQVAEQAGAPVSAEQIDAIFAEWDRSDSPGCALAVVQNGEVVYARGYGMANLDLGVAITPASVFHVASVSKQFTAFAVALLAEEGKLALDDDVRKYVPELPDFGQKITLRNLLQHTSGLRDQYGLFRLAGWRTGDIQAFDDVIDFARWHRRLNFAPGDEYSYCNTSYTLLVLVVERVSGQRFRDFVQERLLLPLKMTHSHIHDDVEEIVPGRASAYAPRKEDEGQGKGGFKVADSHVEAIGAICLYTTAEDLARWLRNLGERRVAGAVVELAATPGVLNNGKQTRYGLGQMVRTYRGLKTVSHGGVDAGYRAEMLWFPEASFGVAILANLATIRPGALARRVADLYLADRLGPDELRDAPAVDLPEAEQARYSGLYRDERRRLTHTVKVEAGKLTINSGFGDRMELTPLGDSRFRLGEPPVGVEIVPGESGRLEVRMLEPDGDAAIFTAAEAAAPTPEALAAYAGSYVCPELGGVRYSFLLRDGALVLRRRKEKDQTLEPTVADAFALPNGDLVFSRDGRGDVDGFDIYTDRIRYLRFAREA
ncbi:MAG TPA: serine hydrolase domain-containing protein [Nitrolancea sp.]|nr:serine hydrolase domain-containing protein [Nitrolancea sp.]